MPTSQPVLHLVCGNIASGKSTLTAKLASRPATILISEDDWLATLFGHEMKTIADFGRCSAKLEAAMTPHIVSLLNAGLSVVLDFHANTIARRAWMRTILQATNAAHQLHHLDVPEEICLARLRARNAAGDHPFAATDEQFAQISKFFAPPTPEEGFNIIVHKASEST